MDWGAGRFGDIVRRLRNRRSEDGMETRPQLVQCKGKERAGPNACSIDVPKKELKSFFPNC